MQNLEINNRDHNYSEALLETAQYNNGTFQHVLEYDGNANKGFKMGMMNKETVVGQIKNINELKKIAPRVRLQDAKSLNELTRISLSNKSQDKLSIPEKTKQELKKYCRTCAGLKLPLVDIFSEKGIQMRLSQQIRHLEEIHPYDSLSTQMCMDCICDLKMSYKFFMQIKKAEVKLKSIHVTLTDNTTKKLESTSDTQFSIIKQNIEQKSSNILENQASLVVQEDYGVPKISSIFSLKDESKISNIADEEANTEPRIFEEVTKKTVEHRSDDNESIEEFDPDDPPFQPESSDVGESDVETEDEVLAFRRHATKKDTRKSSLTEKVESDATIYKYDMAMKSYIRVEDIKGSISTQWMVSQMEGDMENPHDVLKEIKQPNILKRRLLMPSTKSDMEIENSFSTNEMMSKECKTRKLNLNNPLYVNNASEEDGVMYVTVKGSKPNEILLVKVNEYKNMHIIL